MVGATDTALDPVDRRLIAAIQGGLPLVEEPYHAIGDELGMAERDVIERIGYKQRNDFLRILIGTVGV